ncbi:hypothetical protein F5877DRAFT_85239 [Lentinula edodes]|nr:hypothetical protein F5877DRAFT_85239 [Lentinula edodes]
MRNPAPHSVATWEELSKAEKKRCMRNFVIPDALRNYLVPNANTTLLQFARFKFPSLSSDERNIEDRRFFSSEQPIMVDILHRQRLQRFSIPSEKTVARLRSIAPDMVAQGARSIRYAHLPGESTNYPMWVVDLWNQFIIVRKHHAPWIGLEEWLNIQQQTIHDKTEIESFLAAMDSVPYLRKADMRPVHELWRVLGNNWTSGTDIDAMLHAMQWKIDALGNLKDFLVLPVHFTQKLAELIVDGGHRYRDPDDRTFRWLRRIGEQVFRDGRVLLTVVHLGPSTGVPHWVPVVLDGTQNLLLYGDSLDAEATIPTEIHRAYFAWAAMYSQEPLITERFQIAPQMDSHSCGPLAINALSNFALDLPLVDSSRVGFERMAIFQEILFHCSCQGIQSECPSNGDSEEFGSHATGEKRKQGEGAPNCVSDVEVCADFRYAGFVCSYICSTT